ncbi:hypothetical protein AB0876_23850 [Mycobacterium sp. NPDC049093]
MNRLKKLGIIAAGLGAVAVPIGTVAGAGSASADPGLCVNGPYGYAQACVDVPGWYNGWYDGPRWRGGWHGDDQGEDD